MTAKCANFLLGPELCLTGGAHHGAVTLDLFQDFSPLTNQFGD